MDLLGVTVPVKENKHHSRNFNCFFTTFSTSSYGPLRNLIPENCGRSVMTRSATLQKADSEPPRAEDDLDLRHQQEVDDYFTAESQYWRDLYTSERGVVGEIIRDRHVRALSLIDALALPPGSRALEVGCGAGFLSIELANRGLKVSAVDSSEAMVDRARRHAADAGKTEISVNVGDIHNLSFEDRSFDLVVAIGVIPWIDGPQEAIQEVARVTKPGGYVLFTNANRLELRNLLDPWRYPVLRPLKLGLKRALEGARIRPVSPSMTFHRTDQIDEMLQAARLQKIQGMTLGFGPFSLFGRPIVPQSLGIRMHRRMQEWADRGMPVFRSTGMSYLVLARMPISE